MTNAARRSFQRCARSNVTRPASASSTITDGGRTRRGRRSRARAPGSARRFAATGSRSIERAITGGYRSSTAIHLREPNRFGNVEQTREQRLSETKSTKIVLFEKAEYEARLVRTKLAM